MPHLSIQYSANIGATQMQEFCDALHDAMVQTGIFPLGGIRVRAAPCEGYAIADRHPDNAFVDMVLRMAKGRTAEQRKTAGQRVMTAAESFFTSELGKPHFALSLEIVEIDDALSWKANSIHARLKGRS